MLDIQAKFPIGQVVRHKRFGFRGVIYDVDPEFANSEEWYQSIPADMRPRKDQPFYHLFAENHDKTPYIAYVSEQNLEPEDSDIPINHPGIAEYFEGMKDGIYRPRQKAN
ncbi:heat shock protein HspQ [Hwanghaeella sp.]|uniref:heat shock protein HspQ n=1 Tax=Hwanghaeella sp. TaxID=2605943 RepID=UPI003CCBB5AF